jgi:hypothetical protein
MKPVAMKIRHSDHDGSSNYRVSIVKNRDVDFRNAEMGRPAHSSGRICAHSTRSPLGSTAGAEVRLVKILSAFRVSPSCSVDPTVTPPPAPATSTQGRFRKQNQALTPGALQGAPAHRPVSLNGSLHDTHFPAIKIAIGACSCALINRLRLTTTG